MSEFIIQIALSTTFDAHHDDFDGILTPYIRNGSCARARSLSRVDPKNFFGVISHSGYMTVKEEYDSNIFFWYFPHAKAAERPWIIWLQGGPGVTSMLGLFGGVGPLKVEDGEVKLRDDTWANDYSLLFVDNPVGAGYSYTRDERGYTTSQDEIGEQLLEFLLQFLQVFPEMQLAPLYIAGQSYAGKYVPTLGVYVHRYMRKGGEINLKGISIGNGLIDPRNQLGHSELCSALGLLGDKDVSRLQRIEREGITFLDEGRMIDAANKFNESIEFIKAKSGVSIYNFVEDPVSSAPALEKFVTRPDVRDWLHVGQNDFVFNNQHVYTTMLSDIMNTTRPFVEELLEHYGVLLYSGQQDLILPYMLAKRVNAHLQWSRRSEYENATTKRMRISTNGTVVGYRRSGGNLVDILIRKTGHIVPRDQPEVFRFVLNTFVEEFL
ncbi:hypothetical protein ABMA28_013801 [Loxostege sticticalis]|uniref:Serine carboxypeptidase n=1 Tax=Loxostege sticticalis TaxID=481309 RepID=A0ABD0TJY9_LOXSC